MARKEIMFVIKHVDTKCKSSKIDILRMKRLKYLEHRLLYKKQIMNLKFDIQKNSNSLLWVWEFSKKAVLICFIFYIIVQIYAMVVMIKYCDFSYMGELIDQTGQILQNCVFAYLMKAGLENIGKIWFHKNKYTDEDECVE